MGAGFKKILPDENQCLKTYCQTRTNFEMIYKTRNGFKNKPQDGDWFTNRPQDGNWFEEKATRREMVFEN